MLGVVYEVCRNECFYAWKGSKAYLDGKEIRVTDVAVLDKAFVALGFRPLSSGRPKAGGPFVWLCRGDEAVGICCGRALLRRLWAIRCSDRRTSRPVDVAAGGLILMQAGGRLSDFAGGDTWPSAEQVMASNGVIHDKILRLL